MVNPVKPYKNQRLTKKQKAIVKNLRKMRLPIFVYKRKGSPTGVSVHDPRSDVKRHAKKAPRKVVRKYPHATDTPTQLMVSTRRFKRRPKGAKKVSKRVRRSFLLP